MDELSRFPAHVKMREDMPCMHCFGQPPISNTKPSGHGQACKRTLFYCFTSEALDDVLQRADVKRKDSA